MIIEIGIYYPTKKGFWTSYEDGLYQWMVDGDRRDAMSLESKADEIRFRHEQNWNFVDESYSDMVGALEDEEGFDHGRFDIDMSDDLANDRLYFIETCLKWFLVFKNKIFLFFTFDYIDNLF